MPSPSQHALIIHYDGHDWQAIDADHNMMTLAVTDDNILPALPDGAVVSQLLLPVEQLLHRTFKLPFSNPKFIDQDILSQELEEHTSETSQSWWLSWQAGRTDDGVAGVMVGLPESLRQHIDTHDAWRQSTNIGCDMWARLNAQLDKRPEVRSSNGLIIVCDSDSSGIFFGLWHANNAPGKGGFWQAMRRLNWSAPHHANTPSSSLFEDIKRSLHSMGWRDKQAIGIGILTPQLHEALNFSDWQGDICAHDNLPSRRDANISAATTSHLNFRHGSWRSGSHIEQFKPWYRSLALATALFVVWFIGMIWQNHQLEQQVERQQQRIIAAFHTGLPHETVIIDALAQLRKAAGGSSDTQINKQLAAQYLQYLEAIHRSYQQTDWTIKELSFQNSRMSISGQTSDLQRMNKIHLSLQQATGQDVTIQDTDLSNNQVRFKMVWAQ